MKQNTRKTSLESENKVSEMCSVRLVVQPFGTFIFPLFLALSILTCGCVSLNNRHVQGPIMCSIEIESSVRSKDSGQLYVKKWLTDRHTSYQELLGETREEVQAILGPPHRGEVKPDCPGLQVVLAKNPKDGHAAYQVKFWCEEDRAQWFYAIPRWSHLRGSTYGVIHFEKGRVVSVGNASSKVVRQYSRQAIFKKVP